MVFCLPDSWALWELTYTHYNCFNSWLVCQSVVCYNSGLSASLLDPTSIITLHHCWFCTFFATKIITVSDSEIHEFVGTFKSSQPPPKKKEKKMDLLFFKTFPALVELSHLMKMGEQKYETYYSCYFMHFVLYSVASGVSLIIYCFKVIFFSFSFYCTFCGDSPFRLI